MKTLFTILFTGIIYLGCAQTYHKAKIFANSVQLSQLMELGVCVDHGEIKKNHFIISDFSENELKKVTDLGLNYDIIIHDVANYYQNQNNQASRSANRSLCGGFSYATPSNFNYGSMGGFFTYQQYLNHIDSMAAKYPNLVKQKQAVGTYKTHENRDIYWLKISDNPSVDENEPEVFYSAIHHAREVASLSQLVYYMWYLLENYNSDPNIKNLVDNTEMYFIPVVNPDGYIYNETTNPSGGGMWRKNRRNNGDATFGVDLNRNYGYQWGGLGASATTSNDTYRGPSGFSEPETQAIKWFCEQHQFKIALNAHTYSNLLLYPYGYANNVPTPEDNLFKAFSEIMVKENGYDNIISSELYPASGTSDDWFYGEQITKPKIYAMTPEIGSSFWPSQSSIIPLCEENLFMNIMNAKLAGRYAQITDNTPTFLTSLNEQFIYDIKRLGLDGNGDFTVSLTPISSNINSIGSSDSFNSMSLLQQLSDSIAISLNSSIAVGDKIVFTVNVNNGLYSEVDTIEKIYGLGNLIYSSNGGSTSGWNTTGTWGVTTSSFHSSPSSISDSPLGNYVNNSLSSISSASPISVPNGSAAYLNFWMKSDIEAGWDYAQVEISTDGINYTPLCGKFTKDGNGNQATGEPIYDGTFGWVQENIDISAYLNSNILIRFKLVTDAGVVGDGFYFDDLEIRVIPLASTNIKENTTEEITLYPNPTNDLLNLKSPLLKNGSIEVYDASGKLVFNKQKLNTSTLQLEVGDFDNGLYILHVINNNSTYKRKFLISK